MPARKTQRRARRRHVIQKHWPLHTPSEAQGEAAHVVMRALLKRIPLSMCKSIMIECYAEADNTGVDAVTEEIESLFWGIDFKNNPR